jgi:hypothetical protein
MSGLKVIDFFRKIPADLTEATVVGATLSIAAGVFMAILFVVELWAFLSTTIETGVMLDTNAETLLRINFNVTMLDLRCDYAAVDVVDVLGTNSMNVTKNVEKWQLDETGKRMIFQGRNREQKAIQHDEHALSPPLFRAPLDVQLAYIGTIQKSKNCIKMVFMLCLWTKQTLKASYLKTLMYLSTSSRHGAYGANVLNQHGRPWRRRSND